ncbi:MAG: pantoate--beta-alanine ligase [Candidatus Omnitrophota bacterium]
MIVIKSPSRMLEAASRLKDPGGKSIGFVPTMGSLHEGHLSLARRARKENDIVVMSIFVNPSQFGPNEDYKKYPRDIRGDKRKAELAGVDIVFSPGVRQIYPEGYGSFVDVKELPGIMCGASRPGHFKGVCTICAKLFYVVRPDIAYFGQKDYQQALILTRMVKDLDMGFKIKILPTIREKSGLALSSRNQYLTCAQREKAAVIYESLKIGKALIDAGCKNTGRVKAVVRRMIKSKLGIKIDYISIVDPYTLREEKNINSKVLIAIAVFIGKTRLIDNILVGHNSRR